jgi:hypothetical protein
MLIIAVLILAILLIAIPSIVMINKTILEHGAISQKRMKGRAVAEEGISYGMQQLTQNWPFPFAYPPPSLGMPTAATVTSSEGSLYKVSYSSTGMILQPYQVAIRTEALDPNNNPIPSSAVQAIVSQRTVGAKLSNNMAASAALVLLTTPTINVGGHIWSPTGPIVVFDSNTWVLDNKSDTNRTPRKFSEGTICSSAGCPPTVQSPFNRTTPSSDEKEYWSNTALGYASLIDTTTYASLAMNSPVTTVPQCYLSGTTTSDGSVTQTAAHGSLCGSLPANCGYINSVTDCPTRTPPDDIGFTGGYTVPVNTMIFVEGNARFDAVNFNLGTSNAVIVDGNLTLGNPGGVGTLVPAAVIPPTAYLENPYLDCTFCTPPLSATMQLIGFLYVTGGLIVTTAGPWNIYGVLRVDGQLTLAEDLKIFYNDVTNHNIKVTDFELQVDSTTSIIAQ